MSPSAIARLLALAYGGLHSAVLVISGVHLDDGPKQYLSYLPALAVGLVILFDVWAWKLGALALLFYRPNLTGTWRVTIQPSPRSQIPPGGNKGPIDGAMLIEQSFFTIHIVQYTDESDSHSTAATFQRVGESKERRRLAFLYKNAPKKEHESRSHPHDGACELQISERCPTSLVGTYWTGRFTAGDMRLTKISEETNFGSIGEVRKLPAWADTPAP